MLGVVACDCWVLWSVGVGSCGLWVLGVVACGYRVLWPVVLWEGPSENLKQFVLLELIKQNVLKGVSK